MALGNRCLTPITHPLIIATYFLVGLKMELVYIVYDIVDN
jgi:hypothetical protein